MHTKLVEIIERSQDADQRREADAMLSLLTQIAKAFLTEVGYEAASYGIQVFGGHGYISEWGMEQNLRDARISTLYEGTTGIQALDLLGRKVLMNRGETLKAFLQEIKDFCADHGDLPITAPLLARLQTKADDWGVLTQDIATRVKSDPNEVGAASVDYLMYLGYVTLAYFWAQSAVVAEKALQAGSTEKALYTGKLETAKFCFDKLLPRTLAHAASIETGSEALMTIGVAEF